MEKRKHPKSTMVGLGFSYNGIRTFDRYKVYWYYKVTKGTEVFIMKEKKVKMKFSDFECNLLINGINEWRNMLLEANWPTEDVDALLLKLIKKAEGK